MLVQRKNYQIKTIIKIFTALFLSLLLVTYIGYKDEGIWRSYNGFLDYLQKDALHHNITDLGRHIYTLVFFGVFLLVLNMFGFKKRVKV